MVFLARTNLKFYMQSTCSAVAPFAFGVQTALVCHGDMIAPVVHCRLDKSPNY